MSKSQREKGRRGELEAAELLRQVYPHADRRPMQARGAKRDGCEVEGTPWHVEVKVGARPPLLAAMRQAERDTDGRPPLVLARQDRRGWTVTLRWADFALLVAEGEAARAAAVQMAGVPNCDDCGQPTMHAGSVCYGCTQRRWQEGDR